VKLLGKEDLEAGEVPALQRAAPLLALAAVLAVACLVPLGAPPALGGAGDVTLLVALLVLSGAASLVAGLASGSPWGTLGAGREMLTALALEPILAAALVVAAVHAGSLRLDVVLDGAGLAPHAPWSSLLTAAVLLLAFQALVRRVPFDVAEAETELLGGPLAEYSGPKLALFQWAQQVRELVHAAIVVDLFLPWPRAPAALAFVAFWAKVAVLSALVAVVAGTHARYRIDQALRYLGVLLAAGAGAAGLAALGL
jgi:formate hydrogenlyase subunit 4